MLVLEFLGLALTGKQLKARARASAKYYLHRSNAAIFVCNNTATRTKGIQKVH